MKKWMFPWARSIAITYTFYGLKGKIESIKEDLDIYKGNKDSTKMLKDQLQIVEYALKLRTKKYAKRRSSHTA